MTTDLIPGLIGLAPIGGNVGKGIRFGQWLNGEGDFQWEHAFVCLPGNQILEAEPGGAVIRDMHYGDNVYWCSKTYYNMLATATPKISDQMVSEVAAGLKGVPYSFADYAALSAHRLHIPAPGLKSFVADSGHMICSQMADEFYQRLGAKPIFTDSRWPGYVTPASLFIRELSLPYNR